MRAKRSGVVLGLVLLPALAAPAAAQMPVSLPLQPVRPAGQSVSPIYEGWFRNPDGTISLSFGYINRNSEEVVTIAVGPDNAIEPRGEAGVQPTVFYPRRHYGVFTVTVPGDFPKDGEVVWTLRSRGQEYAIPARLHANYEIDALGADASGELPPVLKLEPGGREVVGPAGGTVALPSARVGEPVQLGVLATDPRNRPVTLRWYRYRGPGEVKFGADSVRVGQGGGRATTTAVFGEPGDYVLYVRANNSSVTNAGHAQCCWTNAYVKITVTP